MKVSPGGTISNVGYHGTGDYLKIPRLEWGVGMGDKTIRTALCPGGAERMKRLMRLIETGRVDPTPGCRQLPALADLDFDDLGCLLWPRTMKRAGARGAVLLVLLVALSVCATDAASSRPHAEELEGCCALTGCALVAVTIASANPTAIGMPLHPVAASALPSPTRRPGLPPPEVVFAQAA